MMIVVGAGIIGLSSAWRLAQNRIAVTLFDARETGAEASWAGAGMLAPGGEFDGDSPLTQMAMRSLAQYPDFVAELREISEIDIDFRRCGALDAAFTESDAEALTRRAVRQADIGIPSESATHPGAVAARFYPDDALVNPRDLTRALRIACLRAGVQIREHEPVTAIVGNGQGVRTQKGEYAAEAVLIATGAWSAQLLSTAKTKPVRGHLIAYNHLDQNPDQHRDNSPPARLDSILRNGPTYLVPRRGQIVAGSSTEHAGFDRTLDPAVIADIQTRAALLLPSLAGFTPDETWLGFRPGIEGGIPSIGRLPGTAIWTAFGHYRNGILLAPETARSIAARVTADPCADGSCDVC